VCVRALAFAQSFVLMNAFVRRGRCCAEYPANPDEGYWEIAYDDQGNAYYYHTVTMETSWTNPYDSRE
jgi:hypothetical protein